MTGQVKLLVILQQKDSPNALYGVIFSLAQIRISLLKISGRFAAKMLRQHFSGVEFRIRGVGILKW
jgi:prephenate dehydratase